MANVCIGFAGGADATGIIQAAIKFYGFKLSPGFSVLVTLACQCLGFGVAGLCHPWLVEPAAIVWPGVLGNCALLNSLHSRANAVANNWRISRLKFFMIVMFCAFCWYVFDLMRYRNFFHASDHCLIGIGYQADCLWLLATLPGFAGLHRTTYR